MTDQAPTAQEYRDEAEDCLLASQYNRIPLNAYELENLARLLTHAAGLQEQIATLERQLAERVRCSSCGKCVSGRDPELGLVVRAYVECPECINAQRVIKGEAFNA